MHGRLLPPSPALKELTILIRHGHLSEVRQFLQAKPLLDWKKGDRRQSPLLIAIRTGFYSMVEELLQSGIGRDEMCCAMSQALDMGRLDIIQLLCRFGADPKAIPYSSAVRARDPLILHWLEDNGIDLVTNNPVAMAIKFNHRPALGTLKRCPIARPSQHVPETPCKRGEHAVGLPFALGRSQSKNDCSHDRLKVAGRGR